MIFGIHTFSSNELLGWSPLLLIAAKPHLHEHSNDLKKNISLLCSVRGVFLPHECHVGRLATCFTHERQAALHTHTHTEENAHILLAHSLCLVGSEHMNPRFYFFIFFFFFTPSFNLAHRWRVLTALQPLSTHTQLRHQKLVLENWNMNWEKKRRENTGV